MLLMVPKQWTAAASGGSSCKHHQGSNKGSSSTNRLKVTVSTPDTKTLSVKACMLGSDQLDRVVSLLK